MHGRKAAWQLELSNWLFLFADGLSGLGYLH